MIHLVDFTDHFSHSDRSISALNSLKYNDDDWAGYTDNRYMYMNRARVDDICILFEKSNFKLMFYDDEVDPDLLNQLKNNSIELVEQFRLKKHLHLAKLRAGFVCKGIWILNLNSNNSSNMCHH